VRNGGLDLASRLRVLLPARGETPWPGYEYVKGWGVFGLPFDSGHVLALRVFPENDFGPYRTLWHRDPAGRWSIHVDGPRLDTACPRYYGAACTHTGFATIDITWAGPRFLHVRVDRPSLEWTLSVSYTPALRFLNAIGPLMPNWTWRPRPLLRMRERIARSLGMGKLQLSGVMPSGHSGTLMPERMYLVDESAATLEGVDLGRPTSVEPNPTIGGVPLPARGVLAIGQGVWKISDPAEYERTRRETAAVL